MPFWFSMSEQYGKISGLSDGGLSLDSVNRRVEKDLSTVLGKEFTQRQTEDIQDAVFWITVFEITYDGDLSKENQELILNAFGEDSLHKLKTFLSGKNMKEVRIEMRQRADEAKEAITAYSTVVLEKYLEKHNQLAKHTTKFFSRFN